MADDPRIEPMVAMWRGTTSANADAPITVEWTPEKFMAALVAVADPVDPLRALLADEERAMELLAEATWNRTRDKDAPWCEVDEWYRKSWRDLKAEQHSAVLAALREVAGL